MRREFKERENARLREEAKRIEEYAREQVLRDEERKVMKKEQGQHREKVQREVSFFFLKYFKNVLLLKH